MLELLTQYLSRARSVTIPHLGSLTLETVPATWSVSDRRLDGPIYRVLATEGTDVDRSQLSFIAGAFQEDEQLSSGRLSDFGRRLQEQLLRAPFLWPGVGMLHWEEGRLQLLPAMPVLLAPQAAERAIHADARHAIRQGEQEVWSDDAPVVEVASRRHELEWLAWLLVALAAIFIFWILYSNGFSVHATGLRTTVPVALP